MSDLPPSSDREFWKGSVVTVEVALDKAMGEHYLVWRAGYAVCTSCPYEHTIPLNPKRYNLVDGKVVKRK
jgi:hypothetical protein